MYNAILKNRRCFTSGHCQIIGKVFITDREMIGEFIYMNNLIMELWETSFRQMWQWLRGEVAMFFALKVLKIYFFNFYHVKQRQWPQVLKQTRAAFSSWYSDWQTGQSLLACGSFWVIFFSSFRTEFNSRFISRKSLRIVDRSYVCCATFYRVKT